MLGTNDPGIFGLLGSSTVTPSDPFGTTQPTGFLGGLFTPVDAPGEGGQTFLLATLTDQTNLAASNLDQAAIPFVRSIGSSLEAQGFMDWSTSGLGIAFNGSPAQATAFFNNTVPGALAAMYFMSHP